MISLKQLRCLAAVSETLHFGRAAERCHISQPALSAQIALLEEQLGTLLVERTKRRVLMTPVGREVAERAKRILRDVEDLRETTRQRTQPLAGTLRLGVLPTLGSYLLPHILPALRERYPELRLYLREEPANRLMTELEHGELDLLLVSLPRRHEGTSELPLFFEPFWAVLPLGHRLTARPQLAPADLSGERLILLEQGHCLRDQVLSFAERAGALEEPDFRATSLDSLRQMTATGLGGTLLPALYVKEEALEDTQVAVRPFAEPAPGRLIGLVWRRTTSRAAEFRLFGDLVRAQLPDVVEPAPPQPESQRPQRAGG
jgi:LysR family hydrogen peroxide-inducible transcriptional activator